MMTSTHLQGVDLTLRSLVRTFLRRISLTWLMTLVETSLLALLPLFIGFAIDGLMAGSEDEFWLLGMIMMALICVGVVRRVYDTRVYGTVRMELGVEQAARSSSQTISALNARLGMGRELVDFLEHTLPEAIAGVIQLVIAIAVLFLFSPTLAVAGTAATLVIFLFYGFFHGYFFRFNAALNHQVEQQVSILETRKIRPLRVHLMHVRRHEVRLSDTEAVLYGGIFVVLLGLILFNLHFAVTELTATVGTIFSIVNYSWEFVDSALALPAALQSWSRLSEIMRRLNG